MDFKFNVSLYENPPQGTEDTFQCALVANERLKLYQVFKNHELLTMADLESHLTDSPFLHLVKPETPPNIAEIRRMDHLSHWILRVAYSTSQHDFFIKNELRWFKLRFNNMPHDERMEFLKLKKFEYPEATEEERTRHGLRRGKWFKVSFVKVTSLVRLRLYPMSRGFVFVPEHKLVHCVLDWFQRDLTKTLEHNYKSLPSWPNEINLILSFLDLVKPGYAQVSTVVTLPSLDEAAEHFPLCMKYQHECLRKNHHLKHFSRVQYGLFLKGLGLKLDEALLMWWQEFGKKMTERQFNKEYLYFFKHQYGVVGSKIQYMAQTCDTIIDESVGVGQVNGCPFKHWESGALMKRLKQDGVSEMNTNEIIELKSKHKYKEACTKYFHCLYNCESQIINHPIQYYENCCKAKVIDIEDLFLSDSED